ncbi:MAG TPA: ABC transporter substrate-binding protein [Aggregatilineales bacterium]|nr:ABC transporter substrate-binding protein [Aggregatilineales bacterium]
MNRNRAARSLLFFVLLAALILTGCQASPPTVAAPTGPTTEPPPTATEPPTATPPPPDPVVATVNLGAPPQTLDPNLVAVLDASGNDLAANLFAGLARLNSDTGRVEPLLAERWEQINETTWYVYLRTDMPWVQVDATSSEVNVIRPVSADDVIAAARRACHPSSGVPLGSYPAVFLIAGCEDIYHRDPATLTPEYVAQVLGVRVLNDTAVEFTLTGDSALFPTLLASLQISPVPADLLESDAGGWAAPETILTNGPFALQPGGSLEEGFTLVANPHWPLPRTGNVDVVNVSFSTSPEAFAAWQAGSLDLTVIPPDEIASIPFEDDPSYRQLALPAAEFIVANYDNAPINNVIVRRALALALDRQAIIDEVLEPAGVSAVPAGRVTPPGMALSPAPGDAAALYDVEAARALFAEAGYADCDFMPPFTLLTATGSGLSRQLAERYVQMWNETFGCAEGRIMLEQRPLIDVYAMLETLPDAYRIPRPGLVTLGWQADMLDAQHWQADIFGCREMFPQSYLDQGRACLVEEEELFAAQTMHDDEARATVYERMAEAFFGPQGEMPVIPVLTYTRPLAVNAWLELSPQTAGPLRFDEWVINADMQP